jgi:hypothetical protein
MHLLLQFRVAVVPVSRKDPAVVALLLMMDT